MSLGLVPEDITETNNWSKLLYLTPRDLFSLIHDDEENTSQECSTSHSDSRTDDSHDHDQIYPSEELSHLAAAGIEAKPTN